MSVGFGVKLHLKPDTGRAVALVPAEARGCNPGAVLPRITTTPSHDVKYVHNALGFAHEFGSVDVSGTDKCQCWWEWVSSQRPVQDDVSKSKGFVDISAPCLSRERKTASHELSFKVLICAVGKVWTRT